MLLGAPGEVHHPVLLHTHYDPNPTTNPTTNPNPNPKPNPNPTTIPNPNPKPYVITLGGELLRECRVTVTAETRDRPKNTGLGHVLSE